MRYIHIAPCFGTSYGHRSIHRCITDAVGHADPLGNCELSIDPSDDILLDDSPAVVLVDFPDLSWWRWLTPLLESRPRWASIFLAMNANIDVIRHTDATTLAERHKSAHNASSVIAWNPPAYTRVVSCEPGGYGLTRNAHGVLDLRDPDHLIPPLLQPLYDIRSVASSGLLPRECGLVIASGFPSEQAWFKRFRNQLVETSGMEHHILKELEVWHAMPDRLRRRSISLIQHPYIRRIYSAAGYSAFWEIFMLHKTDITSWVPTVRPIENIAGRIRLLTDEKRHILVSTLAYKHRATGGYHIDANPSFGVVSLASIISEVSSELIAHYPPGKVQNRSYHYDTRIVEANTQRTHRSGS